MIHIEQFAIYQQYHGVEERYRWAVINTPHAMEVFIAGER